MDYHALAVTFMHKMHLMHKGKLQKKLSESLQGESFILHYLDQNQGDAIPGDISSNMCISSARTAAALNSLENKGYITREIDKTDRRRVIVRLNATGKEKAREQADNVLNHITNMLKVLGEDDAKEYVRITGKLAESMSEGVEAFPI